MEQERIKEILANIERAKIAVYGDFCLDAYWMIDPDVSDISIETGLPTQAVCRQRYSPGGAANIVANLAALKPREIYAIGVVGDDVFGRELARQLQSLCTDITWLIEEKGNFDTITYCKRYLNGEEQSRIDFGFFNRLSQATEQELLRGIRRTLETIDVLIFNQQIPGSLANESFIEGANELFEAYPQKIVLLDSRHYADRFTHVFCKTNELEAARLHGLEVSGEETFTSAEVRRFAEGIRAQGKRAVFVTRGARGILICDDHGMHEIPGIHLWPKLDTVGAGDTTVAALACCLATGAVNIESAEFANYAAAVTVQKLFQTGTASGREILEIADDPDFVHQPELAEDIHQANYYENSEVEICCDLQLLSLRRIKHAVFDHDGTISTLRHGWEEVMESMMIAAILGNEIDSPDSVLYQEARSRVREYINNSTGIQTILQMEALVGMAKEFAIVPPDKVLDKFGYKEIYNRAILQLVNKRIARLKNGELTVKDFTLNGAVSFLKELRARDVILYLASGTDHDDVVNEAQVLGYASLFNGGIYGAVGDVKKYTKKMVFENILRENKLRNGEFACFGDGPVEIGRCRNYRGVAVGIASDEVRRLGLNHRKRTRLIKAGAHFILPDFSQSQKLLEILYA